MAAGDEAQAAGLARAAIEVYAPIWRDGDDADYRAYMEDAVEHRILRRLAKAGINASSASAPDGSSDEQPPQPV